MNNCLIYPGTFDPIHCGHIASLKAAYDALRPHKTYLVLQDNRFKDFHMFTETSRYHTLTKICKEVVHIGYEIDLYWDEGIVYFVDVFRKLKNITSCISQNFTYHILIGDDTLDSLSKWYDFNFLNSIVNFVIIERTLNSKEIELKCSEIGVAKWCMIPSAMPISSTMLRSEIEKKIIHDALQ